MTPLTAETRALLTLTLVPGVGPRITSALLAEFGTAERALQAAPERLAAVPRVGHELHRRLLAARDGAEVAAEEERLARAGVDLLALGSPDYPPMLAGVADAPHLLYCRGSVTLADANAVALVGSRHCTEYGRRVTARLASGLARAGVCVVSGLAYGIDAVAHRATLDAGGRTLAVLANGLSRVYPPEHVGLADEVAKSGAVLTESRMGQAPERGLFPARNRIISGLSRVVVVVEAAERSGALITARHAGEQGRTVMAVPGAIDNEGSGGCNALIRDGAVLCRSVDDILEELHGVSAMAQVMAAEAASAVAAPAVAATAPVPRPLPALDEGQQRIYDALADGGRTLDELAQQLGLGVPALSTALMLLEMKKVVRRLPGSRYERQ